MAAPAPKLTGAKHNGRAPPGHVPQACAHIATSHGLGSNPMRRRRKGRGEHAMIPSQAGPASLLKWAAQSERNLSLWPDDGEVDGDAYIVICAWRAAEQERRKS